MPALSRFLIGQSQGIHLYLTLLVPCLFILLGPGDTQAAQFYKGKQIKIIISSSPGGGYDSYGRLLAKHMSQYIPGRPSIVVENMPGSGGLKAANYLFKSAPQDGTVFGGIQRQVPFLQILGNKKAKFVASKFNWLGSLNNEVTLCISWHKSKIKTFEDLKKLPLIVGGSGPNDTETIPAFLNNTLGANFDIVTGYGSSTAVTLAIESGEVEGSCSSYSSLRTRNADWFKNKKINLLIQASTRKHPDLPNVPLALDLASDPKVKEMMALNDARLEIGRPYVAPPNVPQNRVRVLRTAFSKAAGDKKFLADAKIQRRAVAPVSGADVQALIERVSKVDDALIARLNDALVYKAKKASTKIEMNEITGPVIAVELAGRRMAVRDEDEEEDYKAKVSPTRTLVTISGASAKPDAIKLGMKCTIKSLGSGTEAINVDCK